MTQDEVIEMAKDAGFNGVILEMIAHTYKLGAENEREACAKLCDELQDVPATEARHCAQDIRARGEA
jgi:hypothetical protein